MKSVFTLSLLTLQIDKLHIRLEKLDQKLLVLEHQQQSHTSRIYSLEMKLNAIERLLKGGEAEKEGLFFRVTQLESLIDLPTHIRPITKKQMKEMRKLFREGWHP